MLILVLLAFVASMSGCYAQTVAPPDNKGREFIVMFMENLKLGTQIFNLELYLTTQEKRDVTVHITSPKWTSPKVDLTVKVKDGVVEKVDLDPIFRMIGSDVSTKGLLITADGDIACYGANKETLSNDVYLALPTDALGTDYYAMAYSPASIKTEIGIAGTKDGTTVGVTLPTGNGPVDVDFKGHTYHAGETINVNIDKFDTLQLQSNGDLTGAHIQSNEPISVFSGDIKTTVASGNFSDHLVEQMVPTDRWGKQFVTAPIPGRTVGDVFRIVAKSDNTVVTIPGKGQVNLNKGDVYTFDLPSDSYNSITSTEPIMVAQFVKTQRSGAEPADPSMMIIPPYEQFGSDYTFTTPEYSHPEYGPSFRYQNEFMIVAKKSETDGLLLDGKPFPKTTWHDIPGTDLVGSYVTLPHGVHTVRHLNPLSTFGGYLYGHAFHESYGFPTGMRTGVIYDPNCKPTPTVVGDGIDNDCDNKIDEELCDGTNTDDDKDGQVDEDCVRTFPVDGQWGPWGNWSSKCSVTCGNGVLTRQRVCDSPAPKFGGQNCTGNGTETKSCYGGTPCGVDIGKICAANGSSIVPNPLNCAQYYDCTRTSTMGQPHLFECPYPDLFSNITMRCEDFEKVTCDKRKEPMAPCDYEKNQCNGTDPTCKPCPQRLASCVGDNDGRIPLVVFSSEYKDCKKNRTMDQGECDFGYYNPGAHRCLPHNTGTLSINCRRHPTALIPIPSNCAKFYNCSKPGNKMTDKTDECNYPDLFSLTTKQCENFTTVNCTSRKEPKAPCEYDQYKCDAANTTCNCSHEHATCVGEKDGVEPFATRLWSPDYATCLKDRTLTQPRCTHGFFHPVTKTCTDKVKPDEVKDVCKANPTMVFEDSTNCAQFYNCSKMATTLGNYKLECTYPDLFSISSGQCETFDKVNCGQKQEPMAPCQYTENLLKLCPSTNKTCPQCTFKLPSCVGLGDGDQPIQTRMWKTEYVTCTKNRTVLPIKKCSKGYFHPVLKICTEDVNKTDAKPYCQGNPNSVVPVSDNCAQYINCTAVLTMSPTSDPVLECQYPDLFSTQTMSCQDFTTVTCDKRKEPKAPCEYEQNVCSPNNASCTPCPDRLPSCVGLTDGDQAFPTRQWKPDYVSCTKDRTVIPTKKCTKGYFHPVLGVCTEDVNKTDAVPYCKANPTAVIPDKNNCAKYIDCAMVNSMSPTSDPVLECQYPDLFSTQTMSCQDFTTVTCDKRKEPKAPCEYDKNKCDPADTTCIPCADRLPSCVGLPDGNHAFPTRMWKPDYVTCNKDRTVIPTKRCAKGYFHPTLNTCQEDVQKPDAKSYCQANPTEVLSMSDNCAHYINCTVYVSTGNTADPVLECPYPDLFSTISMTCQDFTTVTCDKRPEPQAPCQYDQNLCPPSNTSCPVCSDRLPSCVGLKDGDQPFPTRMWKPDYMTCYKNRTVIPTKVCTKGYFHPVQKRCMEDIPKPDVKPYCQSNPTVVVPMPDNCAQYINCTAVLSMANSADPVQECFYPDLFSTQTMSCHDFRTVTCDKRKEPMAPCDYKQNLCSTMNTPSCEPCQDQLPSCVGVTDGDQPFPGKPWTENYVHCLTNRTMGVDKCPSGAVFDPNTHACTTKIKSGSMDAFCLANPTVVKVNPANCAQYYNCSDMSSSLGHHLTECIYPDLYSTVTQRCEQFDTVQCTNRTEPQAPCEYMQNLCDKSNTTCGRCSDRLPTCVGQPDGDHAFPSRMWKPDYVTCYKNRTILPTKKCRTGYFHPIKEQCVEDVDKPDAKDYCKSNAQALLPMPGNCAQYIDCRAYLSGQVSDPVQECHYPDLWSETTKSCQNFTLVNCGNRTEPEAPCQYEQNLCPANTPTCKKCSDRLPSCVGQPDGPQSLPGQLWKPDYVTCYRNRTVLPVKHCQTGYFHPTLKICTEDVKKVDAKPFCQGNPSAILPMSDNCAHLINCSALTTGKMDPVTECTYPDLFSSLSLTCQRFTTVDCDTRPEPQAPCEYDQNICEPTNTSCEPCVNRLPSCVGLPDGAQPFPTRLWLQDYVQCYKNRTMTLRTCNRGDVFDPVSLGCVSDVPASKMDSYCKANPGVIKKNPDNCAQYYNCTDQASVLGHHLEECKYPDLFSDVTLTCEQFESVTCDKRMEPQAPCDYQQNQCNSSVVPCTPCPDRLASCVGKTDGDHAFPTRLWSPDYVTCRKNRTIATKQCPKGYFHPVHETCETTVSKVDAPKYCTGNPSSVMEIQENCAQYIDCDNFTKGTVNDPVQECHYPDLFSTVTMKCQEFSTVTCDKRPEPTAPCEYSQNVCPLSDPSCKSCPDKFPSCVGLPDGDHAFPIHLWGSDYVTCDRNRTIIPTKKCPGGGYFHPIQEACTKSVSPTDANNYCGANPADIFPMATDCAKFYNCTRVLEGFTDVIQECDYPDLFSTLSLTCQDFTTVQCDNRPEPQAPCEYTQNQCDPSDIGCKSCPDRLPSCVGLSDGDQQALGYTWTGTYVRCYQNRTMSVEQCPSGAVFDPKNRACVSKINPGDIDSYCRANPGTIKPVDTNCAQYYKCPSTIGGTPSSYIQECIYPDLFSTVTLKCEQFETVPCGTRPEPQAPCDYLKNMCNGTDPSCTPCPDRLPSCVGKPDGFNPYPNKPWTADYIECYRNRTLSVKQCRSGYFHPTTHACMDTLDRVDVKDYCTQNPTVVMATEDNCAQFFNCSQTTTSPTLGQFIGECKYPELFSRLTQTCGTFTRILCDTRPEPQAPCEYEKNLCLKTDPSCAPCPERLPSCVGLHDGAHSHPYRLWSAQYIECFYNRTMAVKNCTSGYFHPTDRRCQTNVDPVDVPNYCAEHPASIITAPDNCAVYYNCSSPASGYRTECDYPDLYDVTTKACQDFMSVSCQSRPEPMAPCQYKNNLCSAGDTSCAPCPERLPSCVGLADGNQYFQGREWTQFYITCNRNRTMNVSQCKTGYFNPRLSACVDSVDTPDVPQYCAAHPNTIIPSPSNCAQYINCTRSGSQTNLMIKECDYPDLYSRDTMACAKFTSVDCDTRTEPKAPCEYSQNLCNPSDVSCSPCLERLPSCIGKEDGAQPFPGHEWTGTYIECFRNRTMAARTCPTGAIFDAYQHSCVSRIDKKYIQSFCQFNQQSIKEHPDNCAQYFDCSQPASPLGPYLMECDYPKLFSTQQMTCVDFEMASCDQKKEPQGPCDYIRNLCGALDIQCTPCQTRLPNCRGLPDGKHPIPSLMWQSDYVNCYKNRTVSVDKCQLGYFHPQQRQCVKDINRANIQSYCQVHPTEVLVDSRSCARYFNCTYLTSPLGAYQAECVYPMLFDANSKTCQPFQSVTCLNRPAPVDACEYVQNLCDPKDTYCKPCIQRYPSCHGKPDGNNAYPGLLWKQDYIVCDRNRTVSVEKCPTGYFSERTRACETSVLQVDILPYCQANPRAVLPNPDSCSQFFECPTILSTSGQITECTYPELFSIQTKSCEPFETVLCLDRPEPQEPCSYKHNLCPINDQTCAPCLSRLPSCVGQTDGQHTFAGLQWTSRYVECYKNRTLNVAQCPAGSYFSPRVQKCTQNINTVDIVSFCKANPTVIKAHPSNCAQYYDCSALNLGGEYLKECPYPDLFDSTALACKKFTEVKCGARHEPKSPCEYVKNLCPVSQSSCTPCPERLPSCIGKSDGNHPVQGQLWQRQYVSCDKDRTIATPTCSPNMVFDPNNRVCVDDKSIGKYDIPDYCKSHPDKLLPDPEDCSRYYDCKALLQGATSHLQCTYPDLFSVTESRCVEYTRVQCDNRKEPVSPCQYDHNLCKPSDVSCVPCQVRLPDCTGLPDGDNAITGMLWSVNYMVCQANRTTDVKNCARGVFDPNIRRCSETVGPAHILDLCRSNPFAIVRHPTNCAQYFNCTVERTQYGHFLMECPYPMLFDATVSQCRSYKTVQCGTRLEPQAPCDYFQNLCLTGNMTCTPCAQRQPSCIHQPDGNDPYPGRVWTKEYVLCDQNRTLYVDNCRSGYFDPKSRACVDQVSPVDIPEFCKANPSAVVPDPSNCGRFYNCSSPVNHHHGECTYPQLFDIQTLTCSDFRSVTCNLRPEPQTPCEYSQNLCPVGDTSCVPCNQRNPSCKGLPDGINAAPNLLWSSTYIQCLKNRTLVEDRCKQGVFDPSHKTCVKYVDPAQINDVCRNNPTAIFPDPSNCAKYYDCRASQSFTVQYHKECPYPDLFSMVTSQCENYEQVNCDTRIEPQAPCDYEANLCASSIGCKPCPERLPSCLGLHDGLNSYPGRPWGADYIACTHNRTVNVTKCPSGSIFNPTLKDCVNNIDPAMLKKKPSTLAVFLADTEWASGINDLSGVDRDPVREDHDIESEGEDRDPVSEDHDIESEGEDRDPGRDPVREGHDIESEGKDQDPVRKDRDIESEGEDQDPVREDHDIENEGEDRDPGRDPVREGRDIESEGEDQDPVRKDRDVENEGEDRDCGRDPVREDRDIEGEDQGPVREDRDIENEGEDRDPVSEDHDIEGEGEDRDPVREDHDIESEGEDRDPGRDPVREDHDIESEGEDQDQVREEHDIESEGEDQDPGKDPLREDHDIESEGEDRDPGRDPAREDHDIESEGEDQDPVREEHDIESEGEDQDPGRDLVREDHDIESEDRNYESELDERDSVSQDEIRDTSSESTDADHIEISDDDFVSNSSDSSTVSIIKKCTKIKRQCKKTAQRKFFNPSCQSTIRKREFTGKNDSDNDDGVASKKRKKIVSCKSKNIIAFVEEFSDKRTKKQSVQTGCTSSEAQRRSTSNETLSKESVSKKYFERCETQIPKSSRKKDVNNHNIYVRKLVNSKYTCAGKRKKTDTDWGQVHYCKFCKKIKSNISKHLRIHKHEPEVKAILKESKHLGPRSKIVRAMWDCLRNEGDHLQNIRVKEEGAGEMIIGRRQHGSLDISLYGPCPGCTVWIKLDKTMYRHQQICPALIIGEADNRLLTLKELRIKAMQVSGQISSAASLLLQKEVYTIMTNDEITKVAQSDPLIVSLGNLWLLKNSGNTLKRKYYTSSRMRGAARLLMNLRNLTDKQVGFQEFLKPGSFDNIIKATLLTASPDMDDEEDLKAPSTALKLGYDIKRLVGAKWGLALRNNESADAGDCRDLLKLMKIEWSVKVSKVALVTLQVRRFNTEKALPVPEDLFKLQNHVKQELKHLDLSDYNFSTYRRAEVLAQTRLLMFNKRRSGEVEVISIKDYMKRTTGVSQLDSAMRANMSPLEVKLLETQDVMEVRGKFGRGVPVIVPQDIREVLQYLVNAEVREQAGVLQKNNYLFPNRSIGVIRAYDSLKKLCSEVTLQKPEKLTSVNLRKYTATISQIFDLNSQQQQWLANHLGHSMDIHKIHYRQTSGLIERIDMAKLMLMQELNITAKFAGKKLEDIQLPELVLGGDDADAAAAQTSDENLSGETVVSLDQLLVEEEDEGYQPNLLEDDNYDEYNFEDDDDGPAKKTRKKAHAKDFCDWNPRAVVPNMYNAAQYIDCTNPSSLLGVPHLQECTYPDLFDQAILHCKNFTQVPLDNRQQPQAPCEYQKNLCDVNAQGCVPCPQRLFSCVGLPDGPNGIEGNSWVPDYIECYKNRTMGTKKCDGQKEFDPLKRQCVTQSPLSVQDQCRLYPNKILTHQGSCSLYYNCSKTQATFHFGPVLPVQLEECPYPKLFSTVYQQCLDFQSVQCDNRHEVQAPCQYLQNQCNPADTSCVRCPERLPNCEGLPDGENPVPGHYWSHDYVNCYKNRTLSVGTCRNGYFNPWTGKCVNSIKKDDADDFCKANPKAVVADMDNCAHTFNCDKQNSKSGSPSKECKYPDLFSTIANKCEPFVKVNCESRPEPQAPCEYQQNLCNPGDMTCDPCVTRLPSCIGLRDGNNAVPGQEYTDIYVECQLNRTMAVKKCGVGFFDASLHICVTAINSGNIDPYCKQNQYAVLPHPTNCAWYYNCSVVGRTLQSVYPFDIRYVQECPYPLLFSSATLSCENFPGITCNSHFEPQAPCEYYKNRCDPTQPGCVPCPNRIPSCKNLPDGQQKISNFYDGHDYLVQCLTNRTLSYDVCRPGVIGCYNQVTVLTTPTLPTTSVVSHGVCDLRRGQLVPNPTHCGQYYDCTRSTPPFLQECTYPQMFSEFTLRCQDFRAVTCHGRTEYKQPCDYKQNVCPANDRTCTSCPERLPSCLNLPDGDHPYPGRKWTTAYMTCLRGRTMFVGDCLTGTFDPNVRRCLFPSTVAVFTTRPTVRTTTRQITPAPTTAAPNTPESYCKFHPYEKLSNPLNCAQYYDCRETFTSAIIGVRECTYPQLFHKTLQTCMDFTLVNCEQKYEPQAPCEYYQNQCHTSNCLPCTQRLASCKGLTDGNHPHPTRDNTWYVRCQGNRTMGEDQCVAGVFDTMTRQCRTVTPTTGDPLIDFCNKNPYGYMANPGNCAQYYSCQNANTQLGNHLMECPYPQVFDTSTQRCQGKDFVFCGQRKEPLSACDYKLYQCFGIGCVLCPGTAPITTRAPIIYTQPPIQTPAPTGPTCTGKRNGLNPYPGKELTGHYIICDNGVVVETGICILNKVLDPATHSCIDPADPTIIDAYCSKNPGTTIPSVTNCAQFYVCVNRFGGPNHELRQCAFSQLFSTVSNTCQAFNTVQCGQRNQV